ncbi:MAG: DUF6152 family protein [Rhodospirillaceae bacterium]|nr:DUF6152 family protein [Rhodospirillaceae bacterium]
MRELMRIAWFAGAAALVFCGPASAHHSHAMFDHSEEVTITGTVTKFTFRNPHVFLFVDVEEQNGETVNYWIEMSNLPNMIRRGIGYTTFQPGDVVTVNMWRLKDGRPGGNYTTIVAADGRTYD